MSRSSSTAVAPPSDHQRPPSTSRTRAPLLCQRARWPDPTPGSPPGGPLQAQRQPSAPLDAGQGSRRARRCSRPGNRGGGTPVATGRGYVLAAALRASVRGWQAHKGRGQADQAAGVAARLLPAAAFAAPTWPPAKRLPWRWLTRPPGIRGFALCLPLTEREPLSLRGSRVAEHDRMRVGGRQRERRPACG
jgi:hypothetical protein